MIRKVVFPTEQLDNCAAAFPGRIGFVVKDLATGAVYQYHPTERFPTASVFKVPILFELFRQAQRGQIDLDRRYRVEPDISTHGTGVLKMLHDHPELTLRDYCRLMIAVSDNIATDMVLRAVGADAINATLDELSLHDTRVSMEIGRWHYMMVGMGQAGINRENDERMLKEGASSNFDYDGIAFSDGLNNNVASPEDMVSLLEKLHVGTLAGEDDARAIIEMLKSCAHRGIIPAHIRPEIELAHKHGSSHRIKADVGIIYLPTGALIVAGFTLASETTGTGGNVLATMTRLAVQAVAPDAIAPDP